MILGKKGTLISSILFKIKLQIEVALKELEVEFRIESYENWSCWKLKLFKLKDIGSWGLKLEGVGS